jgi:hypothetical protein
MFRSFSAAAALVLLAGAASAETWSGRSSISGSALRVSAGEPFRSEAIAKSAIEARGYSNVRNLHRDPVGNWAGDAVRGGVEIAVILQLNGEVAEE